MLCLTHLYPASPVERIRSEAVEAFGDDVVLAEDLLSFDLQRTRR
jgi:ribonuclease BN (tRNA processing enzyme)